MRIDTLLVSSRLLTGGGFGGLRSSKLARMRTSRPCLGRGVPARPIHVGATLPVVVAAARHGGVAALCVRSAIAARGEIDPR